MSSRHGYSAYTNGCRCGDCKDAKAAYMRARRAEAGALAAAMTDNTPAPNASRIGLVRHYVPDAAHGRPAAYIERGCRCWPCTDAVSEKRLAEARRHRARRTAA